MQRAITRCTEVNYTVCRGQSHCEKALISARWLQVCSYCECGVTMSLNMSEFEARVRDSQSSEPKPLQMRLVVPGMQTAGSDLSVIGIPITPRSKTNTIHPTSAAGSPKSTRTKTTPTSSPLSRTRKVKPSTQRIVMKDGNMKVSSATIKV